MILLRMRKIHVLYQNTGFTTRLHLFELYKNEIMIGQYKIRSSDVLQQIDRISSVWEIGGFY